MTGVVKAVVKLRNLSPPLLVPFIFKEVTLYLSDIKIAKIPFVAFRYEHRAFGSIRCRRTGGDGAGEGVCASQGISRRKLV